MSFTQEVRQCALKAAKEQGVDASEELKDEQNINNFIATMRKMAPHDNVSSAIDDYMEHNRLKMEAEHRSALQALKVFSQQRAMGTRMVYASDIKQTPAMQKKRWLNLINGDGTRPDDTLASVPNRSEALREQFVNFGE